MADSSHLPPTAKKSNKIRDIVRLQQMLKKWKKAATASSKNTTTDANANADAAPPPATTTASKTTTKGLNKFLKKTLSFSDISSSSNSPSQEDVVRKGYLAVWVGREEEAMKKFVIPMDYLAHQAFSVLLRDAEEEFGFQQEGILKIPCDVPLFEKILNMMSDNNKQRPTIKSSSSTSSFFLYEQDHLQQQPPDQQVNYCSSPHHHHHHNSTFDSQLKTPPTTPTHNLPLYCR